jgi:uncharacterized OsmC-like protein
MAMNESVTVRITQRENFQFLVDFGPGIPELLADEPAPLGDSLGPAPTQLLLAAVANCLSASLLFALRKFKQDPGGITTTATCRVERNEAHRLRVLAIDADIVLGNDGATMEHLDRVLGQFEEFCTVSQSVRAGIPIRVQVKDARGAILK